MASMNEDIFRTEAHLTPPVRDGLLATLVLRLQNVSGIDIWVLNDVTSVLVSSGIEADDLSGAYFDYGANPGARYTALAEKAWIELEVLVNDKMGEMIQRVMRVRSPVTYRLRCNDEDNVVLLVFDVKNPGATGGAELTASPDSRIE